MWLGCFLIPIFNVVQRSCHTSVQYSLRVWQTKGFLFDGWLGSVRFVVIRRVKKKRRVDVCRLVKRGILHLVSCLNLKIKRNNHDKGPSIMMVYAWPAMPYTIQCAAALLGPIPVPIHYDYD